MNIGKNKSSKKKHRKQGTNDQTEEQMNEWLLNCKWTKRKQRTYEWKPTTAKRKKEMYGDKNI